MVTDLLQGGHAPVSGKDKVLCRWLGLNFLLDVFVYSFVTMYSLPMHGSNFIEIFIAKEA
jgi:hypothetical protein